MKSLGRSTTSKILTFKSFYWESVQRNCIKVLWQSWLQSQMEWDSIEAILFLIIEWVIWLLWQIKLSSRNENLHIVISDNTYILIFIFLMILFKGKSPSVTHRLKITKFHARKWQPHAPAPFYEILFPISLQKNLKRQKITLKWEGLWKMEGLINKKCVIFSCPACHSLTQLTDFYFRHTKRLATIETFDQSDEET